QPERVTEVDSPELPPPASATVSQGVASLADLGEPTLPSSGTGTHTSVFAPSAGAAQIAPPEQPAAQVAPPEQPAALTAPSASVPLASRVTRRLASVVSVAAALGALAIWFAMRPVQEPPPARGTTRVDAAQPAPRAPEVSPSKQRVAGDAAHAVDPAY